MASKWVVEADGKHFGIRSCIFDERGQVVRVSGAEPYRTVEEMEATARLVAQAPAMRELLEEIVDRVPVGIKDRIEWILNEIDNEG